MFPFPVTQIRDDSINHPDRTWAVQAEYIEDHDDPIMPLIAKIAAHFEFLCHHPGLT